MTSAYIRICNVRCTHVAVVVVVNSLTLTHCQGLDLGYTFVADFCYQLICGSLMGQLIWGMAYTRVCAVHDLTD